MKLIFKKQKYSSPGEIYLESRRFWYFIQKSISYKSKTICFHARRFAKDLGEFNAGRFGFLDIDSNGDLTKGCSLGPTTYKTAKKRITKAFNNRNKPKIFLT